MDCGKQCGNRIGTVMPISRQIKAEVMRLGDLIQAKPPADGVRHLVKDKSKGSVTGEKIVPTYQLT